MPHIAAMAASAVSSAATVTAAKVGTMAALKSIAFKALTNIAITAAMSALQPQVGVSGRPVEWTLNVDGPIPFAAGRVGVAGSVIHKATYGPDLMYYGLVSVLSGSGPIDGYESFWADDGRVVFDGSGTATTPQWRGEMWLKTTMGHQPDAALVSPSLKNGAMLTGWSGGSRLSGKAAYMLVMGENSKGSAYPMGEVKPVHVLRGLRVWDPRLDSTYPGGSGACRLNDSSTWVYSANPYLWALKWSLGLWEGPTLKGAPAHGSLTDYQVGGIGAEMSGIDVPTLVAAANIADANGWTCAAYPTTDDDKSQVLDAFLQAGGAIYAQRAGKISCIQRAAPRTSIATITAADTAGPIEIDTAASRIDRINTIRPRFWSEAHRWEMQALDDVTAAEYRAEDRGTRPRPLDFNFVVQARQCTQLSALQIAHTREGIAGVVPLKPHLQRIKTGDCFTISEPGFVLDGVKCLCLNTDFDSTTKIVKVAFVSETDGKYAWAMGQNPTPPAPPVLTPVDPTFVSGPLPEDWVITPRPPAPGGGQLPGFDLGGGVSNDTATAVIVEYGPSTTGPWKQAYQGPPTVETIPLDNLQPGETYYIAVQYQRNQNYSDRYVYGPYVAPLSEPSHLKGEPVQDVLDRLTDVAALSESNQAAVADLDGRVDDTITAAAAAIAAGEAASLAALKAGEAGVAANASNISAGIASTKADEAGNHATAANAAKLAAAAAYGSAVAAAIAGFPDVLSSDLLTASGGGSPTTVPSLYPAWFSAAGITAPINTAGSAFYKQTVPWKSGEVYEFDYEVEGLSGASFANVYGQYLDANFAGTAVRALGYVATPNGVKTRIVQRIALDRTVAGATTWALVGSGTDRLRFGVIFNRANTGTPATGQSRLTRMTVRNVTALVGAEQARDGAIIAGGNQGFEEGLTGWGTGVALPPGNYDDSSRPLFQSAYQGRNGVVVSAPGMGRRNLYSAKLFPIDTTRKYRVRTSVYVGPAAAAKTYVGLRTLDAAGGLVGSNGGHQYFAIGGLVIPADSGWKEYVSPIMSGEGVTTGRFNTGTKLVQLVGFLDFDGVNGSSLSDTAIDGIWLEDVTESENAKAQAMASVTSAAQASASAGEAGDWAAASEGSAVQAAAHAADGLAYRNQSVDARDGAVAASLGAGTSADLAAEAKEGAEEERLLAQAAAATSVEQSSIATAASLEAKISADLASGVSVNANLMPNGGGENGIEGWSSTLPGFFAGDWPPFGGRILKQDLAGTLVNEAVRSPRSNVVAGQTITASWRGWIEHLTGTVDVTLGWRNAAGSPLGESTEKVSLGAVKPSLTAVVPAGAALAELVIRINGTAAAGAGVAIARAKIESGPNATAYTTDTSDIALQAALNVTMATTADVANRLASVRFGVSGGAGGDPFDLSLLAGPEGSLARIIATALLLGNVVDGQVVEALKLINGEAYFGAPVSVTVADRRLTIGPGFGVSGGLVMWFGPNGTAIAAMSRTNGYFALGTDGKVYYGNTELPSGGGAGGGAAFSRVDIGGSVSSSSWSGLASVTFTNRGASGWWAASLMGLSGTSTGDAEVEFRIIESGATVPLASGSAMINTTAVPQRVIVDMAPESPWQQTRPAGNQTLLLQARRVGGAGTSSFTGNLQVNYTPGA